MIGTERFWSALATTMIRAVIGFSLALVVGTVIGIASRPDPAACGWPWGR